MAFWASEQKAGQTGWQEVLLWLLCANKGTQHENLIPHLAIWGNLPSCSDQRAHLTTWGSSQGALGAWLQINVVVERFLRLLDPFQYVWYEKFVRQYDEWNQNYINLTWGCGMITNQFKIGQSTSQVAGLKKYDSKITQLVGKWPQHKREKYIVKTTRKNQVEIRLTRSQVKTGEIQTWLEISTTYYRVLKLCTGSV